MARFEIYRHTSPSGLAYVGLTSRGMMVRWRDHVSTARKGGRTAFARAIRKYGAESFTHEVLDVVTTEAGAKRAEQVWIEELDTERRGYNATAGGDGGLRPDSGVRCRLRAAWEQRKARGYVGPMQGRKHTAEAIEKMRAAHRDGRNRPPPVRRGFVVSEETLAKRSAALRGRVPPRLAVEKVRQANLGRKRSEETKARMRDAWARRKVRASGEL